MDFPYKKTPLAAAIAAAFASAPAIAQQTEVVDQPEIEEIVVTGSRIRRTDLTAPSPLSVISRGANWGDGNGHHRFDPERDASSDAGLDEFFQLPWNRNSHSRSSRPGSQADVGAGQRQAVYPRPLEMGSWTSRGYRLHWWNALKS